MSHKRIYQLTPLLCSLTLSLVGLLGTISTACANPKIQSSTVSTKSLVREVNRYGECLLSDSPTDKCRDDHSQMHDLLKSLFPKAASKGSLREYLPGLEFIGIEPATFDRCFPSIGRKHSLSQNQVGITHLLEDQVMEALVFLLKNFADEAGAGKFRSTFVPRRIVLCSIDEGGAHKRKRLHWSYTTRSLKIYLGSLEGNPKHLLLNHQQIANNWNAGSQFVEPPSHLVQGLLSSAGLIALKPPALVRISWQLANPIGPGRNIIGSYVNRIAREMALDLEEQHTTQEAETSFVKASSQKASTFFSSFKSKLLKPSTQRKVVDRIQNNLKTCSTDIKERKTLVGLVVVENSHSIVVCYQGAETKRTARTAKQHDVKVDRKVFALAPIVVSTADYISIDTLVLKWLTDEGSSLVRELLREEASL